MQLLKTFLSIHKTVKVRATKSFILLVLGIVSLFIQAYMHNYNIVYIMMFFLTAVAGTSTLFGMLNLHFLSLKLLSKSRIFATKKASITFLASNSADFGLYDLDFRYEDKSSYLSSLAPKSSKAISVEVVFSERGKERLKELNVVSFFPLIHEKKMREFQFHESLIVYPKPEGVGLLERLALKKSRSGDLDDYKGLSRFEQGENFSTIHWASLAKNDTLMSKRFAYHQTQERLFFSFNELTGSVEERLSQLTLWVVEAERYGYDFTLELKQRVYDSKKEAIDAILDALAQY